MNQVRHPVAMYFAVHAAKDDTNESGRYYVVVSEYTEESARRWLIGHFQRSGWRCKGLRLVTDTDELPNEVPVMPHRPGEND